MASGELTCTILSNTGDERGSSFLPGTGWLSFLGQVADAHITTVLPGRTRGNHVHFKRREALLVLFEDEWQLCWNSGDGTPSKSERYTGPGAAVVEIPVGTGHAIRNSGKSPLWVMGFSNGPWDKDNPDTFRRELIPQISSAGQ